MSTSPSDSPEKTLPILLLELVVQLAVLVVPVFIVACLPPLTALTVLVVCLTASWIATRLISLKAAAFMSKIATAAVVGLGASLGRSLPDVWNLIAAGLVIVGGWALVANLERQWGIAKPTPLPSSDQPFPANSAWGGHEPTQTPEGLPIKVSNQGEIAMGGPAYCDYLFPDGTLLQGLGTAPRFSSDGRWFAAPVPSRGSWSLVLLDREAHRLYHCESFQAWELDIFDDNGLQGRHSPLTENGAQHATLDALLQASRPIDLVAVRDLWLEPGTWQQTLTRQRIEFRSPQNRHAVDGHLVLPDNLRELPDPVAPLRQPEYRLSVDGELSDVLIRAYEPVVWREDGDSFACIGRTDSEASLYRVWAAERGWHALQAPWVSQEHEPSLNWREPQELTLDTLRIGAYLDYPLPDNGRYGYRLHSIHSDTDTQVGHDSSGRARIAERRLTRLRLVVPLDQPVERGSSALESDRLRTGNRALLSWQQDNSQGIGGYQVRIGDWTLPDLWLLDHRVSDCMRYLALVPYRTAPAMPNKVVVADTQEQQLLEGPEMLVARLLDFRAGRVSLAAVRGRLHDGHASSPLLRHDQSPPPPPAAAKFCAKHEGSNLYYEVLDLDITADGLRLRPAWREVSRPQVAIADGDFLQPAPTGKDAAWLFGTQTEYADNWLRPGTARLGGHLLTASGCALRDLAPSMIWSPDGHYLLLTNVAQNDGGHEERLVWRLQILDTHDRTLRVASEKLGNRPQFESFDGSRIRLRTFEQTWESPEADDAGQARQLDFKALLKLPASPLLDCNGVWLPEEQRADATAWLALDREFLRQWR